MSMQSRNGDSLDLQEAAEDGEVLKLEEEIEQMAQKILEYRTTLPDQLSSTLASLLDSQRAVLPAPLAEEPKTRSQGPMREATALQVADNPEEAGKIELLRKKILSNTTTLPVVLSRMREYLAKIDKLESSNGIIHPAFRRTD